MGTILRQVGLNCIRKVAKLAKGNRTGSSIFLLFLSLLLPQVLSDCSVMGCALGSINQIKFSFLTLLLIVVFIIVTESKPRACHHLNSEITLICLFSPG